MIEQEKQTNFFSTKKGEGSVFPFPDLGFDLGQRYVMI